MSWRARLSMNMQEIRVLFCPKSKAAAGLRSYWAKNYQELHQLNPRLPISITPDPGREATMWARYDHGNERMIALDGADERAVEQRLAELCAVGAKMPKSDESALGDLDVVDGDAPPDMYY